MIDSPGEAVTVTQAPSTDLAPATPFWFVIPLRGKAASTDWNRVCRLLRDTVRSALNQTDPDFGIIIACHDAPDLGDIVDPRIVVLQGDFPVPTTLLEQSHDKQGKKRMAAAEVRRRGGGYFMLLDADDFVSRQIVAHVRATGERDGYYIPRGYEYFAEDNVIRPLDDFYRLCGSCYILRFASSDLPESLDSPAHTAFDRFTNHRLVLETAAGLGMTLAPIPFPGAVYLKENGENHSAQVQARRRLSRAKVRLLLDRLVRRIRPGGQMDEALVREFNLPVRSSRHRVR